MQLSQTIATARYKQEASFKQRKFSSVSFERYVIQKHQQVF